MSPRALRSVAIVGDGIAAHSAAAALKRHLPALAVMIVDGPAREPDIADLASATGPLSASFHGALGLDEADIVRRTKGAWRLGTDFDGVSGRYVRSYGPIGATACGLPFVAAWRLAGGGHPIAEYAPGAALAAAGRLPDDGPLLATIGVGLSLDAGAYTGFMAAYARHLGATTTGRRLAEVVRGAAGIAALILDDGTRLEADMHVDASGARRLLSGRPNPGWHDWSAFLPVDRLLVARRPARGRTALDRATIANTWHVRTVANGETHVIACAGTAEAAASEQASAIGLADPSRFAIAPGRQADAWKGNVVAVGDAYACVAPLDAAPLTLLHAQLDLLVRRLPSLDFAPVELADVNREMGLVADSVRDFQTAQVGSRIVSDTLADTRARFADRGRWRQRDGDLFDRDDWAQMLIGTGHPPRRLDTLARAADDAAVIRQLDVFRERLRAAVASAPAIPGFNSDYFR